MKHLGWILLLALALTGAATAAPRWGDDFDWLGDTLAITVPMGMIGFGDTLVCRTPTSMFAMLQTSNTTFQKLWQLNVPVTAEAPMYIVAWDKYSHIVRDGNRFYYGWPRAMVEWNGSDPPAYRGAVRNGTTFVPDTGMFAVSEDVYMNYYHDFNPKLSHNLLFLANRVYTQDSTGTLNFTGYTHDDTVKFTDFVVRWPYAYCVSLNGGALSVVKLDSTPIREIYRTITSARSCKIIRDTLVTMYNRYWQLWSLQNPRQPELDTTVILPRPIDKLWDEPVDSVWFGWGVWSYPIGDYSKQAFCLLSLDSGLTAPRIVDSLVGSNLRYGHFGRLSTSMANVTRLNSGWLVRLPNDDYSYASSHFTQLRQYRDAFNRQRLDTLWYYRQPTGFDSTYLADEQYFDGRGGTTIRGFRGFWGKNGRAMINRGFRYAQLAADTVNAHHEIRWLPQSLIPYGHDGDQVIAMQSPYRDSLFHLLTWTNGQWSDQTMPVPESASIIHFFRAGQVVLRTNSSLAPFQIFRIEAGTLVPDGVINCPYTNSYIKLLRGRNAILAGTNVKWFQKQGGSWVDQNWNTSDNIYVSELQSDSLFTTNGQIYVLPEQAAPYQDLDLNDIQRAWLVYNHSVIRDANGIFWTRYDHTWEGWVERGTFFSGRPFLYYGSILLTNTPGAISTYLMPPNNATPELIGTLPFDFELSNPYPNPFNSTVTFQVDLPRSAMTEFAIYDALGREVYTQPSQRLSPGSYTLHWNGLDNSGLPASSGVYFIQVRAETFAAVKKIVLMK